MMVTKEFLVNAFRSGKSVEDMAKALEMKSGSLRNLMSKHDIRIREIKTQVLRERMENELQTGS